MSTRTNGGSRENLRGILRNRRNGHHKGPTGPRALKGKRLQHRHPRRQAEVSPLRKALQFGGTNAGARGVAATCPNGKTRRRTEIDGQSPVSPGHCRASFHRPFCLGRSSVRSCRRHPGLQLIPTGVRIQFALIVWPARSLPAAGHHTAGPGGLARTAKADCQQHSGYRRRPIANAHTLRVQVFVACAASRYIDTGGTLICGPRG